MTAIADECGFRRLPGPDDVYTGPCPACGGQSLAWSERRDRPANGWLCFHCNAEGDLFRLHRLFRAGRAA